MPERRTLPYAPAQPRPPPLPPRLRRIPLPLRPPLKSLLTQNGSHEVRWLSLVGAFLTAKRFWGGVNGAALLRDLDTIRQAGFDLLLASPGDSDFGPFFTRAESLGISVIFDDDGSPSSTLELVPQLRNYAALIGYELADDVIVADSDSISPAGEFTTPVFRARNLTVRALPRDGVATPESPAPHLVATGDRTVDSVDRSLDVYALPRPAVGFMLMSTSTAATTARGGSLRPRMVAGLRTDRWTHLECQLGPLHSVRPVVCSPGG